MEEERSSKRIRTEGKEVSQIEKNLSVLSLKLLKEELGNEYYYKLLSETEKQYGKATLPNIKKIILNNQQLSEIIGKTQQLTAKYKIKLAKSSNETQENKTKQNEIAQKM